MDECVQAHSVGSEVDRSNRDQILDCYDFGRSSSDRGEPYPINKVPDLPSETKVISSFAVTVGYRIPIYYFVRKVWVSRETRPTMRGKIREQRSDPGSLEEIPLKHPG